MSLAFCCGWFFILLHLYTFVSALTRVHKFPCMALIYCQVLGDNQFTGESCLPNLRACRGQAGAVAMALVAFFTALFLGAEGFSPTFLVGAFLCAYGSLLFGGHALPYALLASSEDGSEAVASEALS